MRLTRGRVILAGLLLVVSCATIKRKGGGGASSQPADQIVFSHQQHQQEEVECLTCHRGVDSSKALSQRHSPTKAVCAECHEVADKAKCGTCHVQPARAGKLARRPSSAGLRFSHSRHAKGKESCLGCHAAAVVATGLEQMPRPRMRSDCFGCHNHLEQYRNLRCKPCHESLSRLPLASVSAFNHEGNFAKTHGPQAKANADACQSCHGQSFCADCHGGRNPLRPGQRWAGRVDRGFIHRGDWGTRHALQARIDPMSCNRCHGSKSCARCHRARGVSASASTSRSPHPADWLSPASPNSHGHQARRHITQCAACHDRGRLTNCIRCHKSAARGGLGLRPHPPGWNRGGRTSERVCRFCH